MKRSLAHQAPLQGSVLFLLAAIGIALSAAGCGKVLNTKKCAASIDCAPAKNVCRNGACVSVSCSNAGGSGTACQAGEMCDLSGGAGMCVPGMTIFGPCKISTDCAPGTGVCRDMKCAITPCGAGAACLGDEMCVASQCAPPPKGTTAHTIAAGGSVSMSSAHIHISLTGQGKAVGASSSSQHKAVTGATSLMRR